MNANGSRLRYTADLLASCSRLPRFWPRYPSEPLAIGGSDENVAEQNEVLLGGVQALVHALEAKDPYTGGHSARVRAYAVAIGREMHLSQTEIHLISLGAELHDIGKIGVRDALLLKPGRLTPEEYVQVIRHTEIGVRILTPLLEDNPEVLGIVAFHHERVDGSGLPNGLAGEEIPLGARIVGVADAFDAMTSGRPYRGPMTAASALREIRKYAGIQFDEDCARAAACLVNLAPCRGLDS